MRVWSIANQKGGVGKTTTTVALGGLLGDAGRRVLLIDLDPHGSLTSYFGYDPDEIEHSAFDLFMAERPLGHAGVRELLLNTSHDQVTLLPASTALATLDRQNAGRAGMGLVLSRALQNVDADFDYALVDSPPLLGICLVNALAACEKLLVPVQTEFLALKGLERMVHTLTMVTQSLNHGLEYLVIPTMFDKRTKVSLQTLEHLRTHYAGQLWRAVIPVDTRLRNASREGMVPSRHDPNGRAVHAYRALLAELEPGLAPVAAAGAAN